MVGIAVRRRELPERMSILAWSISMVRLVLLAIIALLGILQSLTSAPAQTYPARTVRFIVPFGAASGTDITARLFAHLLAARWGKPALGENPPAAETPTALTPFPSTTHNH